MYKTISMETNKKCSTLSLAMSMLLGAVFILSSLSKAVNIYSFAMETGLYINLYMPMWLHGGDMSCAVLVCTIEMFVGLLAFRQEYRVQSSLLLFVILLFFVCLTGINCFFPSTFAGSIESCGCFGELIHFTPFGSFMKSGILWLLSSIHLIGISRSGEIREIRKSTENMLTDTSTYTILVLSFIPPLFSLMFFNDMEHHTYIIAYLLLCPAVILLSFRSIYRYGLRNS